MIGNDAFCPKSGAPLSEESHYDEGGRPRRAVENDETSAAVGSAGELTNGAVRSSPTALLSYFQRCRARHTEAGRDESTGSAADERAVRAAALALRRLRSSAEGRAGWDVHVWYALKRHLDRKGYDVDWMDGHAELWCPRCHGKLRYSADDTGEIRAWCGVGCADSPRECLAEIRQILASLYRAAFDEDAPPAPDDFLRG